MSHVRKTPLHFTVLFNIKRKKMVWLHLREGSNSPECRKICHFAILIFTMISVYHCSCKYTYRSNQNSLTLLIFLLILEEIVFS